MPQLFYVGRLLAVAFGIWAGQTLSYTSYDIDRFPRLIDVHLLDAHTAVVVQSKGDYPVSVVDLKTQEVRHRLVRNGRGPLELEWVSGSAFDPISGQLYVAGSNGKLLEITLDAKGAVKNSRENIVKMQGTAAASLQINGAFLDIGYRMMMNGKGLSAETEASFPLGLRIDRTTLSAAHEFRIPIHELAFGEIRDIDRVGYIELAIRFIPQGKEVWGMVGGVPRLYVFDEKGRFSQKTVDLTTIPFVANPSVTFSSTFDSHGLRLQATGNYAHRANGTVYLGYGSSGQSLPYGYFVISGDGSVTHRDFDPSIPFPLMAKCSVGHRHVACYSGFMASRDAEPVLVFDKEAFFRGG